MGMFDYVRSSYNLGPQFTDVTCQTKDIGDYGIGGTMTHYWIDPSGRLWCSDYRNTHTFEIIEKDDVRYSSKFKWLNFEWVPTGEHGCLRANRITKYIEIYPERWDGAWEDWPTCRLHFKDGIIVEYEVSTKQ
jgi:hypothetical protein